MLIFVTIAADLRFELQVEISSQKAGRDKALKGMRLDW